MGDKTMEEKKTKPGSGLAIMTCPRCERPSVIVYASTGMCQVCEMNRDRATGRRGLTPGELGERAARAEATR